MHSPLTHRRQLTARPLYPFLALTLPVSLFLNIKTHTELTSSSTRLEGVNDQSPNAMSLHTGSTCDMPASRAMTGTATINNCNVNTDGNTGCGVQAPTANSYGPSFNSNGGGIYAMERTNSFIKVWFWPRNTGTPGDVGTATISTDNWVSFVVSQ